MRSEREIGIAKIIVDHLDSQDRMLCFTSTRHSESDYVTLLNSINQYLTFRISHHEAYSGFLSVPTFVISKSKPLGKILDEYLPKLTWINLDYLDYFILSVIQFSKKHGVVFQIDDLYSIFSDEKQGMVFYQCRSGHSHRRTKIVAANGMNEETNKVFRKLYATSLISSRKTDDTLSIYISEAGFRMIDYFAPKYINQFSKDYVNLDWNDVSVPKWVIDAS